MSARWDNIEILQTIDRLQEAADGAPAWQNGVQLMEEIAGGSVIEENRHRGFIQELHVAAEARLLTFEIAQRGAIAPSPDSQPRYYLDHLTDLRSRLTARIARAGNESRSRFPIRPRTTAA